MQKITRRTFVQTAALAGSAQFIFSPSKLIAADKNDPQRFHIGIQEYTFHRWFDSGKLDNLDYPALAKEKLGITHIEYYNRPFNGKHTDKAYVGELAKRTTGEGMTNVLILVDAKNQLDAVDVGQRSKAIEEHKGWIDCAAQLGCGAVRVNCRSGGNPEENMNHAVEGMRAMCDYAMGSGIKVIIEPHGGNSSNPDWLVDAIKKVDHKNAGLLPDFNNFGRYDRYDGMQKTLPHAAAVCAKALQFDASDKETHTDFFRMLKIVYDSDYAGVISIEFEGHEIDPIVGALKTKSLIKQALAAAAAG